MPSPLALPVLPQVRVASPCSASWDEMAGDERVRFCLLCQKNVYNLSAMSAAEAEALVRATEARLCVRFYRRADGTILTEDCPVGRRAARRGQFAALAVVGSLIAWFIMPPISVLLRIEPLATLLQGPNSPVHVTMGAPLPMTIPPEYAPDPPDRQMEFPK
jgi:hypothetical protein